MTRCPDCGAPLRQGETCQSLFDRMLAVEANIRGGAGAMTHFLASATYRLQHPSRTPTELLLLDWQTVEDVLADRATLSEVVMRMQRRFSAQLSVRRSGKGPVDVARLGKWPARWSTNVADIAKVAVEDYRDTVRAWATATVAAINEVRRSDESPIAAASGADYPE